MYQPLLTYNELYQPVSNRKLVPNRTKCSLPKSFQTLHQPYQSVPNRVKLFQTIPTFTNFYPKHTNMYQTITTYIPNYAKLYKTITTCTKPLSSNCSQKEGRYRKKVFRKLPDILIFSFLHRGNCDLAES